MDWALIDQTAISIGILPMLPLLGLLGTAVFGGAYAKRWMDNMFAEKAQDQQGERFGNAYDAATGAPQVGGQIRIAGDPGQVVGQGQGGPMQGQVMQDGQGGPGVNYGLLAQQLGRQGMIGEAMGLLGGEQQAANTARRDESQFGYSTQLAQQGFGFDSQLAAQREAASSRLQRENAALQIGVNRMKAADDLANAGENPYQFGLKFTRKEAADVIGQQMSLSNAHANLGRLVEISGEFGLSGSVSPEIRGEVQALIGTSILPALAQLTNAGVLQEAEAERLTEAIGDPTAWTSIDSGTIARLRTVQAQIADKMEANRMGYTDIFGQGDNAGTPVGIRGTTAPQARALEAQGLTAYEGPSAPAQLPPPAARSEVGGRSGYGQRGRL